MRKRTFTEIEGGNLQGDLGVSRATFQRHQQALREQLRAVADARGWRVLPVTGLSREQVCARVVEELTEWKRRRSDSLQPSL